MTISISPIADDISDRKKDAAVDNLYALLKELDGPQQILLNTIGVRFFFHNREEDSGECHYTLRTIGLNVKEFSQFTYQRRPKPSPNQRWALATLKEEVIHFLAEYSGFNKSGEWKKAVARELASPNRLRDKLFKAQRAYDSSSDEEKFSLSEYAADITIPQRIADFLLGKWELANEFLVDLLLVRDYLKAINKSQAEIDTKMQSAFPETYQLALKFESKLGQKAAAIASGTKESISIQALLNSLHQSWDSNMRRR